jgi:hypothetical protein
VFSIDIKLPTANHHGMAKTIHLLILLTLVVEVAYAQNQTGPNPKRARTPQDYRSGTLKEITEKLSGSESRGNKEETMVVDPDLSPTRVTVSYAGLTRRLLENKAEVIRQWARLYAGSMDTYTKAYEVEVLFRENGSNYWLAFTKRTLTSFWDFPGGNEPVDLFLIRMGAVKTAGKWEPVLLVESFQKPK